MQLRASLSPLGFRTLPKQSRNALALLQDQLGQGYCRLFGSQPLVEKSCEGVPSNAILRASYGEF